MKRALLVGINHYEGSPLSGCVNDVILMTKVLTEKFGFTTGNMKILTDREATKNKIMDGLRWLTRGLCAGDTVVFHYSGHGSQVSVEDPFNTDEPDGFDEIICPVDIDFYDNIFIRDHELGMFFKYLPPAIKSLVVLDCCHSGTGLRNGVAKKLPEGVKNRYIAPPISDLLLNTSTSIDEDLGIVKVVQKERTLVNSCVDLTDKQGDTVLISGCRDNQTSADAFINGRYHGALTYYIVETLRENNWNVPYSELIKTVNQKMDNFEYEQDPVLEGSSKRVNEAFLAS